LKVCWLRFDQIGDSSSTGEDEDNWEQVEAYQRLQARRALAILAKAAKASGGKLPRNLAGLAALATILQGPATAASAGGGEPSTRMSKGVGREDEADAVATDHNVLGGAFSTSSFSAALAAATAAATGGRTLTGLARALSTKRERQVTYSTSTNPRYVSVGDSTSGITSYSYICRLVILRIYCIMNAYIDSTCTDDVQLYLVY
jgi:hypothetical protein